MWESTWVLSTGSFPSTEVLRKPKEFKDKFGTCTCQDGEHHHGVFELNKFVIGPHLRDPIKNPLQGVKICWNAESLWESNLPRCLTKSDKRLKFEQLATVKDAQTVLFKGTYWYRRLCAPDNGSSGIGRNGMAVLRLLAGLPTYSGKERVDQVVKMKLSQNGIRKLRNLLALVDGLLMQFVICFPLDEEIQSWETMDRICNCLISCSLPDYFREDPERVTTFEKVKKVRKDIKEVGFNPTGTLQSIEVPQELSFFKRILRSSGRRDSPFRGLLTTTLSQTRASGVPPYTVFLKTLRKIREVLESDPDPQIYEGCKTWIKPGIEVIHQETLLRHSSVVERAKFFTRISSQAKISLSDSGEFFTKSGEGGKLEAARKVLHQNESIPEIDLDTGRFTGRVLGPDASQGERLFMWACNKFHDRNLCYERNIMSVRIHLVAELGKYRGITVSHLAHACLLHVLSHVLLEYISDIPSSASGVGAANHAWNFFKRISHKNPSSSFVFSKTENFVFSTDWETATDYCDHKVAAAILNNLCCQLGVPQWYRQTCVFALCAPRQIEFVDENERTLESFISKRGILMGDPVSKAVLHCYHLITKVTAKQMARKFSGNS
jgi:hypothetical protein